jgi:hypothetical protein
LVDTADKHPVLSATTNVYVAPAGKFEKFALVPVFVIVCPPGELVTVHVPEAGKPLKATVPVETVHVGCVIAPTIGAVGEYNEIAAVPEGVEVQEVAVFVTVNV